MPLQPPPSQELPPIEQLRAVVAGLRAPDGCPWDKEQTHATLRAGLLEEAYEVVAAIDAGDDANLCEELGDLLLQVVFHAQIAAEQNRFDFESVARSISEKLVRRHPHVFGEESAADSDAVLVRWEEIKRAEKGGAAGGSIFDRVCEGLPALQHAAKVQKKAAGVGFDWNAPEPVVEKVREELSEVQEEMSGGGARLEEEIGDLLFAAVNLARKLKVDPEVALSRATRKFINRFQSVEALAKTRNLKVEEQSLEALDVLWDEVKRRE
jgi:tetrapyrrole methylase family protein/MazG family protein